MAVETRTGIPDTIESGDTVIFTEIFADYPASAWGVSLYLMDSDGDAAPAVVGSGSGTTYTFTLSTTYTQARTPGEYRYAFYATETATSQRERAQTGVLHILPDLARGRDKTANETALESVEAALALLRASPDATVSFNGQSITSKDMSSMIQESVRLRAAVIAEKRKADALRGIRQSNTIGPIFT